jgi:hypothetical protein
MGSSVGECWDTWTRTELLAARGYSAGPESPPALAASVAPPGMTTDSNLELANGTAPASSELSARATPVATNGTEASLSAPGTSPEAAEETAGSSAGDRTCSECGAPLPVEYRPERVICSPPCRQRRHDQLRRSRVRSQMKKLESSTVDASPVALAGPLPLIDGQVSGREASVLKAAVQLSTALPAGWRAELEDGTVTLSWHLR